MIFYLIFYVRSSFLIVWEAIFQGFSKIFRKLTGKNNAMEFMFSNAAGNHHQQYFSDIFLELLEKAISR